MAKETVLGAVQGMSGQCTVETLFSLADWLFLSCCQSQPSGLLVQKEKLSMHIRIWQVGVCRGEGVDTSKSHIWSIVTLSPLCPIVSFCPLVLKLVYSDFTRQVRYVEHKRLSASSKLKTGYFCLTFSSTWTSCTQGIFVPVEFYNVVNLVTMLYLLPLTQSAGMPYINS